MKKIKLSMVMLFSFGLLSACGNNGDFKNREDETEQSTALKEQHVLFNSDEEFSEWVLAHMERPIYKVKDLGKYKTSKEGVTLEHTATIYSNADYYEFVDLVVGVTKDNKVYTSEVAEGGEVDLTLSEEWTDLLEKDIEENQIIISQERENFDKYLKLQGEWGVPHSGIGFMILESGDILWPPQPLLPAAVDRLQELDIDGDKFSLKLEDGRSMEFTIIDDETIGFDSEDGSVREYRKKVGDKPIEPRVPLGSEE